jgi:predicted nicotinamide N-methyase
VDPLLRNAGDGKTVTPFEDLITAADARLDLLPLETMTIEIAGRAFAIEAVRDQDRLLAEAGTFRVFPFGLLLWESGVVMGDAVVESLSLSFPGAVLELGAGAGLGGIVAAAQGAGVTQTDYCVEALALCRRNVRANGVTGIEQRFGDWTDWRDVSRYDLVIGADILYEPALYGDILRVLECTMQPGGQAILTDPARTHAGRFVDDLRSAGWTVDVEARLVPALPPCQPLDRVRVDVIRAARP